MEAPADGLADFIAEVGSAGGEGGDAVVVGTCLSVSAASPLAAAVPAAPAPAASPPETASFLSRAAAASLAACSNGHVFFVNFCWSEDVWRLEKGRAENRGGG